MSLHVFALAILGGLLIPMQSNPAKYNKYLTDEIMREAACKAAKLAMKHIEEGENGTLNVYDRIRDLGVFINGCARAMFWPDQDDTGIPDFDTD